MDTSQSDSIPKVLLVINPESGVTEVSTRLEIYSKFFETHGWPCQVFQTSAEADTVAAIRQAVDTGIDLVVVSGGDGTISQAVTALNGTGIPLGVLPAGTGNLMARDLGIPTNAEKALELLAGEHRRLSLDLMQVGDRCCALNVSIGLSARAMDTVEREKKKKLGFIAYLLNVFGNLAGIRLHRLHLTVDDMQFPVRASEIMVGNTSLIGLRRMPRHLEIRPDDGAVDVIVARALTLWDWVMVVGNFVLGIKVTNPHFRIMTAHQQIRVESLLPLTVQGDGDVIGETPVELRVLPGAVQVIVPGGDRNLVETLLKRTGIIRPVDGN
jgi:YegS/Rv2252/BmrU family lipid kinase